MPLNLNKYKFKDGDQVQLDAKFRGGYPVTIKRIGKVFATVYVNDYEWDVMISRLTPITE